MKKINLEWGNPQFLYPYWDNCHYESNLIYPTDYMGKDQDRNLESVIKSLHKVVGNVKNPDKYSVVFGNGASQLISAILYETPGELVHAPAPYFSRFPVLTHLGDNLFIEMEDRADKLIITAPSNPMNSFNDYSKYLKSDKLKLIDACYNWPQYGNVYELDDDIIVFSLSKATGHAGIRFGWVLLKNKALAELIKDSVEMATMGVCNLAQEAATEILSSQKFIHLNNPEQTIFNYGKIILNQRWDMIENSSIPFQVLNNSGMFLYGKGKIPDHVSGLPGTMFGGKTTEFRLNIGCSEKDFMRFIGPYART